MEPKKIKIDDIEYIRKEDIKEKAEDFDGYEHVLIRGDRSGIFVGYLKEKKGQEVILLQARRIWYWAGAASISQLAVDGVSEPENCKFPCELAEIKILDVIEIIPTTKKAQKSINSVKIWEA